MKNTNKEQGRRWGRGRGRSLLLHIITVSILYIVHILTYIISFISSYMSKITRSESIITSSSSITTPPNHIIVQVDRSWPKPLLVAVPWWSAAAGVKHFSYYDPEGIVDEEELIQTVKKQKRDIPDPHIHWKCRNEKNGYKNGYSRSITLDVIRREDCKDKIVSLVKNLCDDVKKGTLNVSDVDVNYVDKRMRQSSAIPDPELSIYCGEMCCTRGLLPWHIRLTEFMAFRDTSSICEEEFHRILREYSKQEQRFGK